MASDAKLANLAMLNAESPQILGNVTYFPNLDQDIILINSYRLTIFLKNYLDVINQKEKWLTPLSLFLTFILVFCTSDFKKAFGIPISTWQAIFIISTVISFIWLIKTSINSIRTKCTLEELIKEIKQTSQPSNGLLQKQQKQQKEPSVLSKIS
jgi:hypothetical protein